MLTDFTEVWFDPPESTRPRRRAPKRKKVKRDRTTRWERFWWALGEAWWFAAQPLPWDHRISALQAPFWTIARAWVFAREKAEIRTMTRQIRRDFHRDLWDASKRRNRAA